MMKAGKDPYPTKSMGSVSPFVDILESGFMRRGVNDSFCNVTCYEGIGVAGMWLCCIGTIAHRTMRLVSILDQTHILLL